MPLQNRVDPWGKLLAVSARGAFLGNRGILHNTQREIIKPWAHKAWITCTLDYQGVNGQRVKRQIFSPGSYSELFFLDEATAFAAGHRPCAQCRRERFNTFKAAWCKANRGDESAKLSVTELDKQLHEERAIRGGGKVIGSMLFAEIADGTFLEWEGNALLYWKSKLKQWTPTGYLTSSAMPHASDTVTVLTPVSIVKAFRCGFSPYVHESAED